MTHKLESKSSVVSIPAKLYLIPREFLSLKKNILIFLEFIKVEAYQDDLKSFNQLTFFEKLNVECGTKAKNIITSVAEDEVAPFPL